MMMYYDDDGYILNLKRKNNSLQHKKKKKAKVVINDFSCKICYSRYSTQICLPCTHLCICSYCRKTLNADIKCCPQCQVQIDLIIAPILIS